MDTKLGHGQIVPREGYMHRRVRYVPECRALGQSTNEQRHWG